MTQQRMESLATLIQEAEAHGPLRTLEGVEGLSGSAVVGSLQRLARELDGDYLEVGVFRGYTLLSVASVLEHGVAVGIDNFSQFDPQHQNQSVIERCIRHHGLHNAILVDQDYEAAFHSGHRLRDRRFRVYFVDGPHDYRSQIMCLLLATPYLSADAVVIVDDCNYRHVRQANRDFLQTHHDFALLFEAYTPAHPKNLSGQAAVNAIRGWWNGINIMVRDPDHVLQRSFPPTDPDRSLFLNDHFVHAARHGHRAADGIRLLQTLWDYGLPVGLGYLTYLRTKRPRKAERAPFRHMNTYSAGLPSSRFHLPE